ncbi:MAG: hypothetical protein AAFR58_15995 [Cyanobacteria bacterium J06627_28]
MAMKRGLARASFVTTGQWLELAQFGGLSVFFAGDRSAKRLIGCG